jgi:hypothetical protein
MNTTQGINLSTKVSYLETLFDELQHKIDQKHSYARKNLDDIHENMGRWDSITKYKSKMMTMKNQILTSQSSSC